MNTRAAKLIGSSLLGVLLATGLSACGGGGGDAGVPVSGSFAMAAGYKNLLLATQSFSVGGPGSDGRNYTATVVLQPLAASVFALTGNSASRSRQTLTLASASTSSSAATTSTSVTDTYFNAADSSLLGTSSNDGTCSRVTANTALPGSASTGAGGALYSATELLSCSASAAANGTSVVTWSLETASASGGAFALLCQNAALSSTATAPSSKLSLCVEIAADGSLGSRARLTTSISSLPLFSLTATNY